MGSGFFSLRRLNVWLFRGSIPFLIFLVIRLIAAFTFPFLIKGAKFFEIFPVSPFVNCCIKFSTLIVALSFLELFPVVWIFSEVPERHLLRQMSSQ